MKSPNLYLVVIAGGSGTRFWPKSTSKKPKQLLSFGRGNSKSSCHPSQATQDCGDSSLLRQTLLRFDGWVPAEQQIIVTTQKLKEAVQAEAPHVKVLAEPEGRNTAPCIYWASRYVADKDPNAVMLVMPSDHYISARDRFLTVVKSAAQWAFDEDDLVTLGIQPTRPETGYGYLKTSPFPENRNKSEGTSRIEVKRVDAFVEKPSLEKAALFLQTGNYYWNGGMFLWRAQVILEAFDQYMPELKKAWDHAQGDIEKAYPQMTATSIDYGIMEKAKNVVSFPLDCGWDDLGSWTSLEGLAQSLGAQKESNVVTAGDLLAIDSTKNIVDAPGRIVALLGVDDLIVVEQGETILVARKDRAQDIRRIVEEMKKKRPDLV